MAKTPINRVGDKSGTSITPGYIGQIITGSSVTDGTASSTTYADASTLSLTAGVWLLKADFSFSVTTGAGAVLNESYMKAKLRNSTDAVDLAGTEHRMSVKAVVVSVATTLNGCMSCSAVVNISSTKTYALQAGHGNTTGTGSAVFRNSGLENSVFYAVRIA